MNDRLLRQALTYASAMASIGVEGFSLSRFEKLDLAKIETRVAALRCMADLG